MRIMIISDPHLGHTKMQEYCGRPKDFETAILSNIYTTVQKGDILLCLGDVCIGRDEYWHECLHDVSADITKWLVLGNHDKKSISWYMQRWHHVSYTFTLNMYGKTVLFSHMPVMWHDTDTWDINVHGHLHQGLHHPECNGTISERHRLVSMENNHYMPIDLRSIVEG